MRRSSLPPRQQGSLRFPVLHRKSRTLGVGSRGNGCNGLAERDVPGSGLGQHRVFGRIQGHGSGSYGFQQPDRWGPGRRDRRSVVGDYGLCGNRVHVPRRYDSQRADDEPLRPSIWGICRTKQRVGGRHQGPDAPARRSRAWRMATSCPPSWRSWNRRPRTAATVPSTGCARTDSARQSVCNLDVEWLHHPVRGDTVGGAGNQ